MAHRRGHRLGLIAQELHHPGGEHGGLHRLGHRVGGQKQALVQQAVVPQGGAALRPDAGHRQAHGGSLHQVPPPGDVAAGGGQAAAGVFNEGTHHQVGPHVGGLHGLHELPVAVVHDDRRVRVGLLDHAAHLPDLRHRQGGAGRVPLGALDEHRLHPGIGGRLGHPLQVGLVVKKFYLPVFDAVVFQGTVSLVHRADHPQQGVVGGPHSGHQHVPRLQTAVQGGGDGVGAVDELDAHQGGLGAEDLGVDLVQLVPAQVVVAVAGGAGEVGVGHPVGLEGVQHPGGVLLGDGVDAGELVL